MQVNLKNITKTIKGQIVLEDISLNLNSPNIYGFKGKNASGKTMLMRLVCGFISASSGQLFVDGEEVKLNKNYPVSIGALIENPAFLNNFTAFKNLKFLASIQSENISDEDIKGLLELVGLKADDKRTFGKFSLGMKQRLGIASAIMGYPQIVILDEPTNALDEEGVKLLKIIIPKLKEKDCLVLISSHDAEILNELSDVVITLRNGGIFDVKGGGKEVVLC